MYRRSDRPTDRRIDSRFVATKKRPRGELIGCKNECCRSVKNIVSSAHAANEVLLYENLEKLGANALSRDNETELGE